MRKATTLHAHALEDKAARRTAILVAAKVLFVAGSGSLPTSAQIAAATGLAKGTLYLYFRTKEEIFAVLLLDGWGAVMEQSHALFLGAKGSRADTVAAFVTTLVQHLQRHPELLHLDALGYGVLEKNMLRDPLTAHKAAYLARLEKTGHAVDIALRLPAGRGLKILMRTYALTRGLWQSCYHAEGTVLEAPAASGDLTLEQFGQELHEALTEYWRGALISMLRKARGKAHPVSPAAPSRDIYTGA